MNKFVKQIGPVIWRYKTSKKELAFTYMIDQFVEWWLQSTGKPFDENDLSHIKIMRLLFSAVAVTATPHDEGLLKLFDKWHALPSGPVETDVYDLIKYRDGKFGSYVLEQTKIIKVQNHEQHNNN